MFDPRDPASPCYHCLFGEGEELEETRCATMGVFAPLVGIVGATQAAEALKLVAGVGETLAGRLLLLDAFAMRWREVRDARAIRTAARRRETLRRRTARLSRTETCAAAPSRPAAGA